ncbi:S-methyl-5-thioribose kinase [Parasedimentitalea maritima]|uniref:S-methyl-5-thioribose kinase n=1 Tax=Parasedimentitalea maritima TaxID=2578117 RepID=A0A6A4RKB1_9RHOB|nr:S-methyl-5-thioribose kinase [Zongyanglinia marina]KAE9631785.1 S-methyl-5-thioribose kinase [Zongyanglinia marina]
MLQTTAYKALTSDTLSTRLGELTSLTSRVGTETKDWKIQEVGDGNLNLVFIVEGSKGSVIVKQALPYVRLVGDSWPLPLYRAYYEHEALVRQAARNPGTVPEIYHFDSDQALIVMEFLSPHTILRHKLIAGERVQGLAAFLGTFCARTAFRGSELSMKSSDKKTDVSLFAGNIEIPAITEALVFSDPYFNAERNHHTPELDDVVNELRQDVELKTRVQELFMSFASNTETMVHGDLHSGSVMSTATDSMVIDPEFAQYGPMSFDLGMLIANFLMAYFSQPGHRSEDTLDEYQEWILAIISESLVTFEDEFTTLWNNERTGMLYPPTLFEDQGHSSQAALQSLLNRIRTEAMGYCGIEMHRRTLSLAHNADFEEIKDNTVRASLEARNLMMGRELILTSDQILDAGTLVALARQYNKGDFL